MRIAIVGAGVAGRALYRLLELEGFSDVDIYGFKHSTKCGISPCGWGVCTREFRKVLNDLQMPGKIIHRYEKMQVGDMNLRCDLSTFDKPAFLRQMCPDSVIDDPDHRLQGEHDLIVDATGTARALLPPIKDDLKIMCRQELYTVTKDARLAIVPSGSIGYSWLFPLDNNTVHIGITSVKDEHMLIRPDAVQRLRDLAGVKGKRPDCSCKSEIRMLSPKYCKPIVHDNIVGVGEAVGTVSPLCGAGIVPAIRSATLLADNVGNLKRYEHLLISDFSYLDREVSILRKIGDGKRLDVLDVIVMRHNAARFGIFYGWKDAKKTIKMVGGRLL